MASLEIDAEVCERHRPSDGHVVHPAMLLPREVSDMNEVVVGNLARPWCYPGEKGGRSVSVSHMIEGVVGKPVQRWRYQGNGGGG